MSVLKGKNGHRKTGIRPKKRAIRKRSWRNTLREWQKVEDSLEKFREGMFKLSQFEDEDQILSFLGLHKDGWHGDSGENLIDEIRGRRVSYRYIYALVLIYHMGAGHSYASFSGVIGVQKVTLDSWYRNYKTFQIAVEIGEARQRLKWEKTLNTSADGKNRGNAASIIFGLKNYFPDEFKDKREVEHSGEMYVIDSGIARPNDGQEDAIEAEWKQVNHATPLIDHRPTGSYQACDKTPGDGDGELF